MRVRVFGNSPSPSIANYCLLKTAESAKNKYGQDVADFVSRSFYVDGGLLSSPSPEHAIDLRTRTREDLNTEGHLRLHKIASNSRHAMDAFPKDDIAEDLQDIDRGSSDSPMQRNLGLFWNLQTDCFTFKVSDDEKPFTRRGVLSVVNSLYDPLGFIAPIVVQGKLILREVMQTTKDWDEPLPDSMRSAWDTWRQSLHALDNLLIPRSYVKMGFSHMVDRKIFVNTDASEKAVPAVSFLKATDATGQVNIGFIMGKAKVPSINGHSIPRLELCAALMGIQIAEVISSELDIDMDSFHFFSDSKVTLGYICTLPIVSPGYAKLRNRTSGSTSSLN